MTIITETNHIERIVLAFNGDTDGSFKAAAAERFTVIYRDGVEIFRKPGKGVTITELAAEGFTWPAVAAEINAGMLLTLEQQTALIATLTEEKTAADAARDAAVAQLADLQSQLAALQPPVDVNGVPQSVPRRQAKTVMELTPNATHGDLWQAALAAANAIEDRAARIVTVNYLLESLYFEHPKVSQLAVGLLGMTQDQVDALFVAAAKL